MGNRGRSDPNLFGGYTHYDEKGHKMGRSDPNLFGGYTTYDSAGHKTGRVEPNLFGGYTTYDSKGHKTGTSQLDIFGGYTHYDMKGHKAGSSDPKFLGGYSNNSSTGGCYVATCVYGSYDCPEVWTLRRYRDGVLAQSVLGRAFIRTYYLISPSVVRCFGNCTWFRKIWRDRLDKMVTRLNVRGIENTPYKDTKW